MEVIPPQRELKHSLSFVAKTLILGLVALLLLIPLLMVEGLVSSRQYEGRKATQEITSRWGESQNILTPVLVVPYTPDVKNAQESALYLIPEEVSADAVLDIENRHRSIYEVAVYTAHVDLSGTWRAEEIRRALSEVKGTYDLSRAKVALSTSDATGYRDIVRIKVNGKEYKMKNDPSLSSLTTCIDDNYGDLMEVTYLSDRDVTSAPLSADLPLSVDEEGVLRDLSFSLKTDIAGSEHFGLLAVGVSAKSSIKGNWPDPSFRGKKLPDDYSITDDGFEARWSSFAEDNLLTESGQQTLLRNSHFVSLLRPVDNYAQTERSVKYGVLVIALTLLSVYLVELTMRRRGGSINLLSYVLTGLSLVLFYTLLLSMSEVIGFGLAYLISAVMTIGLNTIYFRMILRETKKALLLGGIMTLLYLTIYVLMQLESYALLIGSLVLFVILAIVMYISAKTLRD